MKSTIKSLLAIFILGSGTSYGQADFFWNQYSVYNPAATGTDGRMNLQSVTSSYFGSGLSERVSADFKSKKLHGGIGGGYATYINGNQYQNHNPYLNYAFHAKTGENSTLSIGAGLQYHRSIYKPTNGGSDAYDRLNTTTGVHFQVKNWKFGVSTDFYRYDNRVRMSDVTLYADYTHKFNENWSMNTSLLTQFNKYGVGGILMTRATYKQLSFGMSGGLEQIGGFAEYTFKKNWSVGYQVNFVSKYGLYNHSLMLKFKLPNVLSNNVESFYH